MWDPCSQTRDRTPASSIGRQSLNHWIAGEVPLAEFFKKKGKLNNQDIRNPRVLILTFLTGCFAQVGMGRF